MNVFTSESRQNRPDKSIRESESTRQLDGLDRTDPVKQRTRLGIFDHVTDGQHGQEVVASELKMQCFRYNRRICELVGVEL